MDIYTMYIVDVTSICSPNYTAVAERLRKTIEVYIYLCVHIYAHVYTRTHNAFARIHIL